MYQSQLERLCRQQLAGMNESNALLREIGKQRQVRHMPWSVAPLILHSHTCFMYETHY